MTKRLFVSISKRTFYEILNISPNSNIKEIKSQYYKLCKLLHPDTSKNISKEEFHDIMKAYEVLKDPIKRKEYDKSITEVPKYSMKNFEFRQHSKKQKISDESLKFWSRIDKGKKVKAETDERIEEYNVFKNRFLVLGAVLIGYWLSINTK